MADSALTQSREISITVRGTTANMTIDSYKALLKVIEGYEKRIAAGETFAALLTTEEIIVVESGDNPYVLYKFQFVIGTDPDASPAVYEIDYIGSAAVVADLPAAPAAPAA